MKAGIFHIQGSDSIQRIQDHFNSLFPSMQISFFLDPEKSKHTDQCIMYSPNVKVSAINPLVKDLAIEIAPDMRMVDLEKIIKSMGLHAQISCRIVNRVLPESSVSNWLLKDVYGLEMPFISNKQPFTPFKRDSIIK